MWNQFEPVSNEDETLGSAYFTNGLLKISNEKKSAKNPTVLSSYQNNTIVISVDSSLILLEDEATDNCRFLSFGAEINCFAFAQSGNYIVCCLRNGNIHAIHTSGVPLFNLSILPDDISEESSFIDVQAVDDQFYMLCTNGRLYKIQGIDEDHLLNISGIDPEVTAVMNTSASLANIERISAQRIASTINSFCVVQQPMEEFVIICCSDNAIIVEDNQHIKVKYPEGIGAVTRIFNLDNCITGFTDRGNCVEFNPFTRTISKVGISDEELQKFAALDDLKILDANAECIELLTLSLPSEQERQMRIVEFPSLKGRSELTLPETSWLVSQPKSSINMYFIAGFKNEDSYVQTIELKSITEADPEERFNKLLLKGHFTEAEAYAKSCDLSLEPLHQARVRKMMMEISVERNSDSIEGRFEALMKQLDLIEDKDFLVSLTLSNDIPDRLCLTRFLEYIQKNIDTNKYAQENNEINELLLRLETLRLIDPYDTNMEWRKFLHQKDMLKAGIDFFRSDVLLSCLIWSRHASSIIPNMNLKQFYLWFNEIRSTVEPFQLIQWLKHFTPCFLQIYPAETTNMVEWCINRTHSLQFSSKWPEIGLEFITSIKTIFDDLDFLIIDVRRSFHCNMEKIQRLICVLEEMVVLKKRYHLTMPLKDYQEDSFEETAFKLFQRIQIQNIRSMVNDFLLPVFLEHGSLPEETIVRYINFLATNKNLGYWQERAVACTDLLNNEENRLNCALLILKVSPVPWSNAVLPLAELGTKSNHPIANCIFVEYKNQAIKIIKLKYGWPVDYFDLQQDRIKLALRILKINNPEMIEDIKTLVKSSPDAYDAYFFLIHKLVELGRFDELIDFISSLEDDSDSSHALFEKTINILVREIENEPLEVAEIKNYIEAIKILLNQLKDTMDEFKLECTQKMVLHMKHLVRLQEEFHFKVNLKDLREKQNKLKLIITGVEEVAKEVNMSMSIDNIWNKLNLLAQAFDGDIILVYLLLCRKLNNVFVSCKVIDVLCQSEELIRKDQIENALRFAVLVISQQIIDLENNNFQLKQSYDPLAFPLVYELLTKCLSDYNLLYHGHIMDFLSWIGLIRAYYPANIVETTRGQRTINEKVFSSEMSNGHSKDTTARRESLSMFEEFEEKFVNVQPTHANDNLTPVLQCVCNAMKMIALTTNPSAPPYTFMKSYLEKDYKPQALKDGFFYSLENILKLKLNVDAFVIIQKILYYQSGANITIIPQNFISTVNKKMLKFMLSQKDPAYFDAFIIFRSESSKAECLEYLKSSLKNNSQRIAFSTFSEMYNKYQNNNEFIVDRESRLKLFYYSELCKYYPTLKSTVNLDTIAIGEFLKDLENRQLPTDLLKKLSKDFGWNYQKSLVKQIKLVLRKQELEFDTRTDEFGKAEVVIKTSVEAIKRQCLPYLTEITDSTLLGVELEKFFDNNINDYFYELFLVVIDLIVEHSKEAPPRFKLYKNILLLLKHKLTMKRRSIESDEQEHWMKHHASDNIVLPTISSWRLPFNLIIEQYPETAISKDLIVETFETYYPLIQLHSALKPTNDINERTQYCALAAAKNSVQDMRTQAETTVGAEYNLKPRNNAFLQAVLRMTRYLNDKGKALAILFYIVNTTPKGCDQMEASYECWKFALAHEHHNDVQSKYADVVAKIKIRYPFLKTQHMLHLFGLADDKLLKMIDDPVVLINALYEHESILQPQKKEINKLCKEIASLYNIDLMALQVKMLKSLLSFAETSSINEDSGNVNETVYEDFLGSGNGGGSISEHATVSDENVVRAYYILGSWSSDTSLEFIASELSSDRVHAENQLQLFECFAKLVDDNNASYVDLINIDNYLLICVCHFLKTLGYNYKPQTFKDCDKVDLLKKIWTSHYSNTKALEVMSLICLGFGVHLPQIWNGILKQMVAQKMISHVSILVEILSTKTKFLHLSSLKLAWEYVIKEPLVHGSKIQSFQEDQKLSKSLILLQKCPISTFLNMANFAEKCILLERPHMGAIFLAFAKESDRKQIMGMLEHCNKHELRAKIEELEDFGIAPVISKSVINILNL